MKKALFLLSIVLFSVTIKAQDCENADLKTDSAVKKAEPCVTEAADYILSHPSAEQTRYYSFQLLIINWMEKTDFTFNLNKNMIEVCNGKDNSKLLGVYMACLAKCAIQYQTNFTEPALKLLVDYIENLENKIKQTSKIKKLIKAKDEDKLSAYL